ncbi:hypothetical protein GEMRC1_003246 [Eukaryota sp. GEM-RC1]
MFNRLHGKVSAEALEMVHQQYLKMLRLQEVEEEDPFSEDLDCKGYHRRVYGIPCAHELLQVRKRLTLEDFHVQWLLQKSNEEDSEDEEDVIDILYRNWESYTSVQQIRARKYLEQALQVINEPLLPPSEEHANTDVQEPIRTNTADQSNPIPRKKAVCKNCNALGHYQKTCKQPCGNCGEIGHKRKECTVQVVDLQ